MPLPPKPLTRPATAEDVTASWLSKALQSNGVIPADVEVASLRCEPLGGGTGVFGVLARLVVSYTKTTTAAPTHMVLKLPTSAPENKNVALALGIYVRETHFFDDLASRTPVPSVRCLYADMDIDAGEFVLVIEEIMHLTVGDQLHGATVQQLERTLKEIAKWHAAWWEHPALGTFDWLPTNDSPIQLAVVPGIMRGAMPVIESDWISRVGEEAVALGRDVADKFEEIMARSSAAARTLCHGDLRLENVFFNDDASDIMFIDFQLLVKGSPAQDVQYLFGSSMDPEMWDQEGMRLSRLYYNEIVSHGVTNYSWNSFWSEFQLHCLWAMVAPASTVSGFDMGDDKGKQLAERWMMRGWYLPIAVNAREVL